MRNFDFLVIGAMKSGTTTVHDILSRDPRIALPLGKETPFFTDKERMKLGLDVFFKRYYSRDLEGKCVGKVSPQYMAWYEQASKSIMKYSPDTKLIVVLRDPIDRLLSHYSMCVGMGIEARGINEAIKDCLMEDNFSCDEITRTNSYVLWSSYGDILLKYKDVFPNFKTSLLILGFNELVEDQSVFSAKIYHHLGLDFSKNNTAYVKSLSRSGDVSLLSKFIVQFPSIAQSMAYLAPYKYKGVIRMMKIEAQIARDAPKIYRSEINQENLNQLKKVFEADKYILRSLGYEAYWSQE